MAGTGETTQKVWVLSEITNELGQNTCEVIKVFGNTEAAIAAYLEMTPDHPDEEHTEVRADIEANRSVVFTFNDADHLLELVEFVGPMSGGRRKRKTTRRRR